MPRPRKIKLWTSEEIKLLRRLTGHKSAAAIGRALKRSEAAVRFKAHMEGVSLAVK